MTKQEFLTLKPEDRVSHTKDGAPKIFGTVTHVEEDSVFIDWGNNHSGWINSWNRVVDELTVEPRQNG